MNSCQTMGIWVVNNNNHYISSIGQTSYLTPELTIFPKRRSFSWKTPYSTCVSHLLKEGAFCGWILCPSPSLYCLCLYLFLWLTVIQLSIINYHLNSTNQLWLSNLHLSVFRVFLLLLVPGCLCTLLFFAAMTLPSHKPSPWTYIYHKCNICALTILSCSFQSKFLLYLRRLSCNRKHYHHEWEPFFLTILMHTVCMT